MTKLEGNDLDEPFATVAASATTKIKPVKYYGYIVIK